MTGPAHRPAWVAPSWMNQGDVALEDQLCQALRQQLIAARDAAFRLDTPKDIHAWRWRMNGMIREAKANTDGMERLQPHTPDQPADEGAAA